VRQKQIVPIANAAISPRQMAFFSANYMRDKYSTERQCRNLSPSLQEPFDKCYIGATAELDKVGFFKICMQCENVTI
jgi:hypothetical protein